MAASSFRSFPEMFQHRISSTPDADALAYPDASGTFQWLKWRQVGERVRHLACGLRSLGLSLEERAAIVSNTRYEWVLCDLAIGCATGAVTTIYPSTNEPGIAYILKDSSTRFVFAEDDKQVAKLRKIRDEIPGVEKVIVIDGAASADGWVMSLSQLEDLGRTWDKANAGAYEAGIQSVGPEHLATLIYTSGTTGDPKGVVLAHDCWVYEAEAMDGLGFLSPADKQFLWLPLSHSFGKVLEAAVIYIGIPTAIDGRIEKIVENMAKVQPTFSAAVPRIFEKAYNRIVGQAKDAGGVKYKIFKWSLDVGREVSQIRQKGGEPGGLLALKHAVADRLVFSKVRDRFGGKLRCFISGSAPLSRELAEFFHSVGILILEGYGLTETSAATFVNRPEKYRFGTVGFGLPGVQVKLAPEDGEILLHSRGVMRGYHNKPEATAETLTADRWLRTGDIGTIDADGFLKITDRKKDLIKTSGGKYVAPQDLEGRLKTKSPLVGQVIVHGNNRNFCTALIAPEPDGLLKWGIDNGKATAADNLLTDTAKYAKLSQEPGVRATLQAAVDALNAEINRYETIKKFHVLDKDLTIDDGDLTPSMKVKRKTVEAKYKAVLDSFYAGANDEG